MRSLPTRYETCNGCDGEAVCHYCAGDGCEECDRDPGVCTYCNGDGEVWVDWAEVWADEVFHRDR